MIKELRLESWKSFADAALYVDPLTVLIGPNSGGKSNALDALLFLNRTASGLPLTTALQGDQNLRGIRGGLEWAAYHQGGHFALTVTMQGSDARTEYRYRIEVAVGDKRCDLRSESLERLKYRSPKKPFAEQSPWCIGLFRTDPCDDDTPSITARLYNEKRGTPRQSARSHAILGQLAPLPLRQEIEAGVKEVSEALRGIFVLDPIPAHMRVLLRVLTEIGEERGVDVLVTTHNPAFLDACGPELVPFITVAHRDPDTGASRLTPLEDIAQLPKLLASGTVGKLSSELRSTAGQHHRDRQPHQPSVQAAL